jgi:hypothetical protein
MAPRFLYRFIGAAGRDHWKVSRNDVGATSGRQLLGDFATIYFAIEPVISMLFRAIGNVL